MQGNIKRQKLILLSILLLLLLSYPFISIFSKALLVAGLPVLYAYIFFVWIFTIVVLYRVADHPKKENDE